MISVTSAGSVGFESISDQIGWRCFVRALMTTTGWASSKVRAMSVMGTGAVCAKAAGVSRPGTLVMIMLPGLKPSLRLYGPGSMPAP
jgi:hypothetical protein